MTRHQPEADTERSEAAAVSEQRVVLPALLSVSRSTRALLGLLLADADLFVWPAAGFVDTRLS